MFTLIVLILLCLLVQMTWSKKKVVKHSKHETVLLKDSFKRENVGHVVRHQICMQNPRVVPRSISCFIAYHQHWFWGLEQWCQFDLIEQNLQKIPPDFMISGLNFHAKTTYFCPFLHAKHKCSSSKITLCIQINVMNLMIL